MPAWAVALGAAHLLLSPVTRELVSVSDADRYFLPTLGPTDALAAALALVVLSAGLFGASRLLSPRLPPAVGQALGLAALGLLVVHVATLGGNALSERQHTGAWLPRWQRLVPWGPGLLAAALAVLGAAGWWLRGPVLTGARWVLGVLGGFGVWTLGLLLWAAISGLPPASEPPVDGPASAPVATQRPRPPPSTASGQRVVWLLFDELDHRAAFEEHLAALPNLRVLRDRGVLATQAYQAGEHTLDTVPDMFTGQRLEAVRPLGRRALQVTPRGGRRALWHRLPTWAHAAHAAGQRVGIAGAYHPYCRLYGGEAADCVQATVGVAHTRGGLPLATRVLADLATLDLLRPRRAAIAANVAVLAAGRRQALDADLDVTFMHVLLPHEPFTWDVDRAQPQVWTGWSEGYRSNLRWVDHWLGGLRRALAASPLGASTTLVISADHGWRASQALAGRPPDRRVALLVVPPGSAGAARRVDRPISARAVGPLVQALALGELPARADAIARWLGARPVASAAERTGLASPAR